MTNQQKRQLGICACVGTMIEYCDSKESEAKRAFVANISKNTDKTSYSTLEHLYHSLEQSPLKEIMENKNHTHVEMTFDHASNYISKEYLYGCTKVIAQKYPHIRLIRWAPLCPCHGKTDLDRRFSSFTSWITTHQYSNRIGSAKKMVEVINSGVVGSNLRRKELGDKPIPTSANLFSLQQPPPTACMVNLPDIKSIQCVTFIPKVEDRLEQTHSGFYNNVYPWIS